jgi:HEAT repeat protein
MALVKSSRPSADSDPTPGASGDDRQSWIADLASDVTGRRRAAARALAELPDAVPLLLAHLAKEEALSVRSIILTGLILHKSPMVVAGLMPLLACEDANLRCGAVEALQEMPDEVAPHVERLLDDPDSDVRIATVMILSSLPHPRVPVWLQRVVATDPHVNVAAAALDALAELGDLDAIDAIESLPGRFPDVSYIAFAADVAIKRIRGR